VANSGRSRSRTFLGRGGCAGCGCVLTLGLILALVGAAIGITLTARIPGTHSNVTLAGSIGKKELTKPVLSRYAQPTFGGNHNLINSSNSLTVWLAQGRQQFVVGKQTGAPLAGIDVRWKSK
jgi:hypothetical protein